MRQRIAMLIASALIAFGGLAAAPAGSPEQGGAALERAEAASAGQVKKAGDNAAELVTGWLVPVLFVMVGFFTLVALAQRSLAMALVPVLGGLLAGFFLIDPQGAQDAMEGIYSAIF